MSSIAPTQSNDYQVTSHKVKPTWNAVLKELNSRLKSLEAVTSDLDNLVSDAALATSQAVVNDTFLPILSQLQNDFATLSTNIGLAEDALVALQAGGIDGVNVTIESIDGLDAENTQAAIVELLAQVDAVVETISAETEARDEAISELEGSVQTALGNSQISYATLIKFQ